MVLIYSFPHVMTEDVDHPLLSLLTISTFSLKKCLFKSFTYFFKDFIYLFLEREEGREKERERNIDVYKRYIDQLPLVQPQLGTWPAAQTCALTGNRTGDLSVHRLVLNPLSLTSQDSPSFLEAKDKSHTQAGTFGVISFMVFFFLFFIFATSNKILFSN